MGLLHRDVEKCLIPQNSCQNLHPERIISEFVLCTGTEPMRDSLLARRREMRNKVGRVISEPVGAIEMQMALAEGQQWTAESHIIYRASWGQKAEWTFLQREQQQKKKCKGRWAKAENKKPLSTLKTFSWSFYILRRRNEFILTPRSSYKHMTLNTARDDP